MKHTNYVVGFCFDLTRSHVALIKKNRPDWQKGFLNGLGGKIREDETAIDAMTREFIEEGSLQVDNWTRFCDYRAKDYTVFFFKAFTENMDYIVTKTDETVSIYYVSLLYQLPTLPNLKWLIPLALDKNVKLSVITEF